MFKQELCSGFDPKQVTQELARRGFLETTAEGAKTRYQVKWREPGAGNSGWFFLLKPSILRGWDSTS